MEATMVSASTGVMNSLLAKLGDLLGGEYKLLKQVRGEIIFLESELRSMNALLQRLADMQKLDPQMTEWRYRVRELAYDIEDCVDLYMHQLSSADAKAGLGQKIVSQLRKIRASHQISSQIQELKARVVEESERQKRYMFHDFTSGSGVAVKVDPRLSALYVEEDRLVGIDGPKDEIIERLMDKQRRGSVSEQVMTVSIVGCGGSGKTTLANQIYCKIKGEFQHAAFVSVFQNPNIKKVLTNILSQVGADSCALDDEQQIIDNLREYLSDKRYIVVVDDLWDTQTWKIINCALVSNRCGSRIMTTTRKYDVAEFCCSQLGDYVYEMRPLSVVDSKRLFFKRIFDPEDRCPPQLKEASDEILKKCGGLPLAIISISSLLASKPKSRDQWNKVRVSLSCTLEKTPDLETMRWILSLSYFDLPKHLKTCLLYLSIFPEGCEIRRERLVSRWIAEGFINQKQGQNAYEVGNSYFNELVNRSLIQPASIKRDGQTNACRVDDTIHDFIVSKAIEENFATLIGASKLVPMPHSKVRRLSLQNGNQENMVTSKFLVKSHVRSLTIFINATRMPSLLGFDILRVLDLEDCYSLRNHHLTNLERLHQLRYLNIRGSCINELPKQIGELQHLETLDIRSTYLEELPSSIVRIKSLVRLLLDYHVKLPKGISNVQTLEELTSFSALMYEPSFLQELGKLTNLRELRVIWNRDDFEGDAGSHKESLYSCLSKLGTYNLQSLFINFNGYDEENFSLDKWHPAPFRLRRFCIDHWCPITKVPSWMGSLTNLEELVLYVDKIGQEDVQMLGYMPALLSLTIYSNADFQGRITMCGFKSSKFFKFYGNSVGLTFESGSMLKLECLDVIFSVFWIKCSGGSFDFGLQHLSNLRNVYVQLESSGSTSEELEAAEAAIKNAVKSLPGQPKLNLRILR